MRNGENFFFTILNNFIVQDSVEMFCYAKSQRFFFPAFPLSFLFFSALLLRKKVVFNLSSELGTYPGVGFLCTNGSKKGLEDNVQTVLSSGLKLRSHGGRDFG